VAFSPVPHNPSGSSPSPRIRGHSLSSPAQIFSPAGLCTRPQHTLIPVRHLQDSFPDFHPIYTNHLNFFLLPSATKTRLGLAQPASIPWKEESIKLPVAAGLTSAKTLTALPLPGCGSLARALPVGTWPFLRSPTASLLRCGGRAVGATRTARAIRVLCPSGARRPEEPSPLLGQGC